jgi:hypothetical protein
MAIPTIAQTIVRGDISTYLIGNANSKGSLYGGKIASPFSMVSIAMVTDALRWGYEGGAQTDDSLRSTANYLIWLFGAYGLEAEVISGGAGGGTVVPGGGGGSGVVPQPIDWIVSGSASGTSPLATGQSSVTFNGSGGMPDLRGYNIQYTRGGTTQYTTNPGDGTNYYSWSSVTGVFTIFGPAGLGEPMRIFI